MKLVFYSNYLNHHQVQVADELFHLLGNGFRFVATLSHNGKDLKGGLDYSSRPYCILASESNDAHLEAIELAKTAGVCVFGASSQEYAVERAKYNPDGLSFEMGERWLKHGWLTIGSPVFRRWIWNYYRFYRKANYHKLCCSSFTSGDDAKLNAYKGRHYKWGYFTSVPEEVEPACANNAIEREKVRFLWCARFLSLKHPELVIELAARLKAEGYNFSVDIYGDEGNPAPHDKIFKRSEMEALIKRLDVGDVISLKGNRPNAEIIQAMQDSDIYLFTSDHLEGWGAVANEAMANGCVLVASDAIGSTGYLVTNRVTGMVFKSCSLDSLYEQVKYLLDNPQERERIASNGRQLMREVWSPANAAKNLIQLIEDLSAGRESSIRQGPCSKA